MYCSPNTKNADIIALLARLKDLSNPRTTFILGNDYNINLLNSSSEPVVDFIDNVHERSLHPLLSLPTHVTNNSSFMIDHFLCDISLFPVRCGVVKTDFSDHYLIDMGLKI